MLACTVLVLSGFASTAYGAQAANLITSQVDASLVQPLPNHHPLWANAANDAGPVAPNQAVRTLTLVLARPATQQKAFEQFLADQQNSSSPNYHHWLTPAEVGERFGLTDADIGAITGWLQSQGLHVNWVAPSKIFIGFGGTAADVSHAFQTDLHNYTVNGKARISIASDPSIPQALAPAIKAIHGLYTVDEEPQNQSRPMQSDSPEITVSGGTHFIGPGDFFNIYSLPNGLTGAGETIGIVGRARTNVADFNNFKTIAGSSFTNPTEVVPTAFGGVDPGPAYTAPPASGVSIGDQSEATLDVVRAGTVAPGAQLLLVVASSASGGIEVDAQYLVNTTPVPAQVMTISFGACELSAGTSGVSYWNSLFQQAAAEGISTFVSSDDSGASGCDTAFAAPPASPKANSPNYICSSSYATCVGGTEFNDASGSYWTTGTGGASTTAVGYIPEGGWNESWNGTTSTVAASGGGVSSIVATPPWQVGVPGVPAANTGRYTPDLSFSSSSHDGYFLCFAAGGGACVVANGSYYFSVFSGTSAAAPSMAGIAALLDQNLAAAQGNLNPGLYQMWYSAPTAFHDVTVASSGVATCDINTASMCNSSIPGPSGVSGGQAGYLVGTGYDEVTGLGSLNATNFVNAYSTASKIMTPTVSISTNPTVATNQALSILITVSGGAYSPFPTGSVLVTIGSYTSAATALTSGTTYVNVPAGTLPTGGYTLSVAYTPDAASAPVYKGASASQPLTVTVPPKVATTLTLTPSQTVISSSQVLTIGVAVNAVQSYPVPTGSVTLTSGSYASAPVVLAGGSTTITVPAGSLAVGNDTLTVTYTPDAAGAASYLVSSNFTYVQNQGTKITPSCLPSPSASTITTAQALTVTVTVNGFTGNPTPTGTVVLTSGSYASPAAGLSSGTAIINLAAGALPVGLDTLTATYTPDAQSSSLFSGTSGSNTVGVSLAQKITPTVAFTQLTSNPTTAQPILLTVTVSGGTGNPAPSGFVRVGAANFGTVDSTLSGGSATVTLAPGSFASGANVVTASYYPDTAASYYYNQESASTTVSAVKATPTVTVSPSLSSAPTTDTMNVTVTVSGGSGAPAAAGQVTLTSGQYSSTQPVLSGTAGISIAPGSLLPGTDTLTAAYSGDSNYNTATGTNTVVISVPANASFAIGGTAVTVTPGATSGNGSTVTVTPANGFVGAVALTAAITSSPAGAQYAPTLSFGASSPVSVVGFNPATATLTISTTAATTAALHYPAAPGAHAWPGSRWYAGGAALSCLLIFLVPVRRRRWLNRLGLLALFVVLCAGLASCGGSSSASGSGGGNVGTTAGQYTITITGTAGSTSTSGAIVLTVN